MGKKPTPKDTIKCKVRILCPLPGVYSKYQPNVGGVYDAEYKTMKIYKCGAKRPDICTIDVLDKKICLKTGEYEILEDKV